jgi:hypothetical protein
MTASQPSTAIGNGQKETPVPAEAETGGVLVIMSCDGYFWDGADWIEGWAGAKRFAPLPAAFPACQEEARRLRAETGVSCSPFHVQTDHLPPARRRRRSAAPTPVCAA